MPCCIYSSIQIDRKLLPFMLKHNVSVRYQTFQPCIVAAGWYNVTLEPM